ncbi:putative endonuclease lcl3 [Puccinia graminis f. sp. tritici]|uniref:Probable endonuclease LCL3 n=1 Tax=Puccinia graminis f. sp. tritici TaxID=56615 RepID=A0A5B0LYK4_PUCGR|nr:putative endonuclease lcl3 [Puccinia graminis f. sp. tritici]
MVQKPTFDPDHRLKLSFIGGSLLTGLSIWCIKSSYKKYFHRIRNADYVTPDMLKSSSRSMTRPGIRIKGFVTSVGDADNFRIYHTPGFGWNWLRNVPKKKTDLKDMTIHIRLAGVDAPELAHFGNPAQPFSREALDFLTGLVNQRKVAVDLLSKDRYNRIVGMAFVRRWKYLPFTQNVSLAMVQKGLATVYRSAGAEYGRYASQLERAEVVAKRKKLGIWSLNSIEFESPRDYKLKHSSSSSSSSSSNNNANKS